jgi:predicted dehydrogenase
MLLVQTRLQRAPDGRRKMGTRKARIAVVGCGGFARSRLYPSIQLAQNIRLAAVCDLVPDLAAETARRFGAGGHFTDMEEMLDAVEPDGVCVIGPAPMQFELGMRVLARGFHLYTEKPCANTAAEADELASLADERNLIAQCGFMKRYSRIYPAARSIAGREEFGPVRMIEVRFTQGPYPALWGIEEPMRAMLVGQLVHIFDLVRFLAGDVRAVSARLHQADAGKEYGAYAVLLELANGGLGVMNLNALESDTWHFNEYVRLSGFRHWLDTEDMLHLRYHPLEGWTGEGGLKNQCMTWEPALDLEEQMLERAGYAPEIRDFADCCLTNRRPRATAAGCAEALRIGEAIWRSAQADGQQVEIECRWPDRGDDR